MYRFVTFVFFCSGLAGDGRGNPVDTSTGVASIIGLIFEQKAAKSTKEDSIPFSLVIHRCLVLTLFEGRGARCKLPSVYPRIWF